MARVLVETHVGNARELARHVSAQNQPTFFSRLRSVMRKTRVNVRKPPPACDSSRAGGVCGFGRSAASGYSAAGINAGDETPNRRKSAPPDMGKASPCSPRAATISPRTHSAAHFSSSHLEIARDRPGPFASDISNTPEPHTSALAPHHKMFSGKHVRDTYSFRGAELLGTGGIGSCQTVTKRTSGHIFAMKSVYIEDRHMLDEFRQECAIQRSLDHPNIVRVYESFEEGPERVHIVMEVCTGGNLVQLLEQCPLGMDEATVAQISRKILSAVYYMHQRGFVHRDIKPDNIMFESPAPDASPKLIDFGFACPVQKGAEHIKGRYGTLSYMAPELLDTAKRGAYDSSVDLWSFGVTVYTLLTARKPFDHEDRESKKRLIREADPTYSSLRWSRISPLAIDFVQSLIQKEPSSRLSASQALQHPWLQQATDTRKQPQRQSASARSHLSTTSCSSSSSSSTSAHLPPRLVQSLLTTSAASLLTRMVLEVITFTLQPHQLHEERAIFSSIDCDSSGTLSRSEFVAAISSSVNLELAPSTIDDIFSVLDINCSGHLDFNEFCAASVRCRLLSLADRQVVESAFCLLDVDNDGILTLSDLLSTYSKRTLTPAEMAEMRRLFASNYDGLDIDDFWRAATATGRFAITPRTRQRAEIEAEGGGVWPREQRPASSPARRAATSLQAAQKRVQALRESGGLGAHEKRVHRSQHKTRPPPRPPPLRPSKGVTPPRVCRSYSMP
uniref:Calmodulin n=1 Tax=Coccolithus braarudii TaxID=221442 RepID=A0A7S0LBB0_9EUKA|mmetsp:Transcript_28525/g.61348  ORF Transcript_28525/g.61348 Transcript_28525/m.61348 type:complete len:732 (+) Transcript_28525:2-2197(+)